MKFTTRLLQLLSLFSATLALSAPRDARAQSVGQARLGHADSERRLIELSPGQTRWIVEAEKWPLKRVSRSPVPGDIQKC